MNYLNLSKKIIGLFALCLILNSCVQDENLDSVEVNENSEISHKDFFNNLENYKENYSYTNSNLQGKRWWETAFEVAAIATADAAGAGAMVWAAQGLAADAGAASAGTGYAVVTAGAAVIGAAGGSYGAYCAFSSDCGGRPSQNPVGDEIVYDFASEFDHLENIGSYHNIAMMDLYLAEENVTELDWIKMNIENVEDIDIESIYYSEDFQNATSQINDISTSFEYKSTTNEQFLSQYLDRGLINENINEVLLNYFETIFPVEVFEDIKTITDYYVEEIQRSELSKVEKESILATLSVSIQSYYFWTNLEQVEE